MATERSSRWIQEIKHSGALAGLGLLLLLLAGMSPKGFQMGSSMVLIAWGINFCALIATSVTALLSFIISRQVPRICVRLGVACLIFFPVSLLYLPLGKLRWDYELAQAESYPQKVERQLEAYKSANGHYPTSLEAVPNLAARPNGEEYYVYKGNYYFCYFYYWSGMYGNDDYGTKNWGYNYSSQTRQWEDDRD